MDIRFSYEGSDFENNEVTVYVYMTHKEWLDNEYSLWIKALQESTVHNFKEHPGVKRMLGEISALDVPRPNWDEIGKEKFDLISKIDRIGRHPQGGPDITGTGLRMIFYAMEILKRNPISVCEIGGGVGQFYAILRVLGWKGSYKIRDLPEAKEFQYEYLNEVSKQTGLMLEQDEWLAFGDMLVSFYALGEFDNETKQQYEGLIETSPHGYIAWNPHSGSSESLSIFENHDIKVTPGVELGISIIEW
jgi:hypothetical protein